MTTGIFKQPMPSLRALAKQSMSQPGKYGLLRRFAPRNDADTVSRSRGLIGPRFAGKFLALQSEGAGNAGRPTRPQPGRAEKTSLASRNSHHGHAGITRHSPRNGFTAYFVLSPVIGLSCHRHRWNCSHQLDAGVEASGPHDFAVRAHAVRPRHARVHRIPPRVDDVAQRPSVGGTDEL